MPSTLAGSLLLGNGRAPIYKLPQEALVQVFQIGHARYNPSERALMTYLTVISSVCSIWRYVALHEPSLWTAILYNDYHDFGKISKSSNDLPQKIKDRICSYLSRSQYSALLVYLEFGTHGYGLSHVKSLIFPYLSHCRILDMKFDSDDQALDLLPLPTDLRRLAKLSCWVSRRRHWREAKPLFLFSGTDRNYALRDLTLRMSKMPIHQTVLGNLDGRALIELRLSGDSLEWDSIISFLSQCQSLQTLELAVRPPLEATFPSFTLPNLVSLQATNLEFPMAIHAPRLRSLVLFEGLEEDDPPVLPPLPSWRDLHTLRIMGVDPSRPDFIALLRANPTIKVLTIGLCDTEHGSLGEFGELFWKGGPRIFPDKTNEPHLTAARADPSVPRSRGRAKKERKRRERAEQEEYERKQAETEDSYKAFLPSLRLFQLVDQGDTDVSSEYVANVLERRPHLRFDGGESWDGPKVDSSQMGLIDQHPVAGDIWRM